MAGCCQDWSVNYWRTIWRMKKVSIIDAILVVLFEGTILFDEMSKPGDECCKCGCCCRTEQKLDDGTLSGLVVELMADELIEAKEVSVIDDVLAVV